MIRRVLCAVTAFGITTALLFPLNLLWVGDAPLMSLFEAMIGGFVSFVATLTVQRRDPLSDYPMPRWVKMLLTALGVLVLVGLAAYEIVAEGVAVGVTRSVALLLSILAGAVAYRFDTNE